MIKKVFLLANEELQKTTQFQELVQHIKIHYKKEVLLQEPSDIILEYSETTLTLLYASDIEIKTFIKNHLDSKMNMGILPTKENPKAVASYGVSKDLYEACDDCFDTKRLSSVDLLLCNNEPTFTNIIIGDVHGLNNTSIEKQNIFTKLKGFISNILNLSFRDFTFTTAKEQIIQTAATGVMVLEHNVKKGHYNLISDEFSLHDGKLNAFILAPTSKLAYLYYLFIVFFYSRFSMSTMPKSIGVIKSSFLNIKSSKPIDFQMDGKMVSAESIDIEVKLNSLNMILGRNIEYDIIKSEQEVEEEKDTVKIANLPKGEMKNMLISEPVPLFKKATESEFKELFISLKQSAKISSAFVILMILSTLLATTGLFQSSAPVIIGAMILAPLMAPIVSLSMGVVRGENFLIKTSFKTLFIGIVTALIFSCIFTYFMPLSVLTDEMRGRLNPNILDLMVAIFSGIAGAYANSKSEIAKSLAGVAIAVALVPPLSVTGIGIGWGDIDIIFGSFLLFITNLVGITLAASLTFVVLGYAPIHRAKKGIVYTLLILALVTVPLVISFTKVIQQNRILDNLSNSNYTINNKEIKVNILEIDLSKEKPIIYIQTISKDILNIEDLKLLNKKLSSQVGEQSILNIDMEVVVE